MEKVTSLQELKRLVGKGRHDYFIQLNFGLRSSKQIDYDGEKFYVFNFVDSTEQVLSDSEIMDDDYTNIGVAINRGAFWAR